MTIRMKVGFNRFVLHISKYFQEAVEVVIVFAMLVFAVITLLPIELLPTSSAYDSNLIKIPFGILLLFPSLTILWLRIQKNIHDYIFTYHRRRKQCLFYITIGWFYLTVLRATIGWFPPFYILYGSLGIITFLCYMRLSNK